MTLPQLQSAVALFGLVFLTASGQEAVIETMKGSIFKPAKLEATPERIATLKLPDEFKISVFAENLKAPRMMAVTPEGNVYITRRAHPETGKLYGMDHGIDWLGDDVHREELNEIRRGGNYGWPYVFEDGKPNPADNPEELTGMSWEQYAATCEGPVLTETAHSAPMALIFYRGKHFPADFDGDALVTFHGSWNRGEAAGYKVMRLKFDAGKPVGFEDFLSGFYIPGEKAQFGRPCGLALMPDGSILMSDDSGGMIYRITYR